MTTLDAKRWSNGVFAGLFLLALILFSRILLPFLMPVLLGGFLVVLFLPLQDGLARRLGGRKPLAAGLSTLIVFLLLLLPLMGVGWLVAREVLGFVERSQELLGQPALRQDYLAHVPPGLRRHLGADPAGMAMERALHSFAANGTEVLQHLLGAGTELVVNLFLMAVALYYFFLDGRRLVAEGSRLVPLDRRYLEAFFKEFRDVAHALIYGNSLTALVQGLLGWVGLWIAGVPHAGIWAAAMVFAALVPVGGTALLWGPIGLLLLLGGKVSEGLFLLAWGAFIVSTVDNVLRPKLCGARMSLHPLLVFLSMFGGLAVFGMMGLFVGPLIAALFMSMVRIYRRDFLGKSAPLMPATLEG